MSMKYHINPNTGLPGVCYAKMGKCPYGDDKSHYPTFGEAQSEAFERMSSQFPMFDKKEILREEHPIVDKKEERIVREIERTILYEREYSYLEDMTDREIVDELATTNDKALIEGVLSRRLLVESDNDDDKYIIATTMNKNFPQGIVEDIIDNPDGYNEKFVRAVVDNQELSEHSLFGLAKKSKSPSIKRAALGSRRISADSIVLNVGADGSKKCPDLALYFAYNPNTPSAAKSRLLIRMNEYDRRKRMEAKRGKQ